jgi:hypothetical protein
MRRFAERDRPLRFAGITEHTRSEHRTRKTSGHRKSDGYPCFLQKAVFKLHNNPPDKINLLIFYSISLSVFSS